MPRDCHVKGKETGLWFEIKCIEEHIAKLGKDASFEKGLLKSYKKVLAQRAASIE